MKLSKGLHGSMVLQYATEGGEYGSAAFDSIPCDTYCPVVCFSAPNQNITMENISDGATVVKDTVKREIIFLVTNRMEMFQSSSTLAIELIAKNNGDSLKGIHSETVRVTASALRRILIGSLLGREDVLDFAFPTAAKQTSEEGDDTSETSDHSFQLAGPSDSPK
ncbi:unnamed protein product [Prorocentrum cordatum]|uniref:Uncharacterized protein n=1 Tax=Prorocentrum cordatum TaxID=2364126 RepID=A0ABN9TDS8_9DINO|nr:unnamed protein product [Polarella glacialis]|mmetsp:Transcript_85536/g.223149  ORF Transcript_85536/g.223149 Transcript_85536/m.223149 type:complete len:165 (-) Transcript_85536:134-628(-)